MATFVNNLEVAEILEVKPEYVNNLMRRHGCSPAGIFESGQRGRPSFTWKRGDVSAVKTSRTTKGKKAARPNKQKSRKATEDAAA